MKQQFAIGRIIAISAISNEATVMVGDAEWLVDCAGQEARPGDIFRISRCCPPRLLERIGEKTGDAWSPDSDDMRWRIRNGRGQTRHDALHQRHVIRRAVRDYLDGEGFLQIDAPLLVRGTTPDANIQSFSSDGRYLITSSEYQIKRLEVGGFERIYSLTQNFRKADGEGHWRNPEFTMLEWARAGETLRDVEDDAEQLTLRAHHDLRGTGRIEFGPHTIDLAPPWDRISVSAALERYACVKLPDFKVETLRAAAAAAKIPVSNVWDDDVYFLFSLLMDHIQPSLGLEKPLFLQDWPAFETSSALEKAPGIAERSELFIGGVEISDGFPSLTSPKRQQQTFEEQNRRRARDQTPLVELDQAYLAALATGMPSGAGMALGFDRLVMVLTNRLSIRDVLAFAWDEV